MNKDTTLAVPLFIKERRKKLSLSQEKLAEKVGVVTATISNLETGRNGFTDKTIASLAAALECEAYELFVPLNNDVGKVKGERAIKTLLKQVEGLPEEAINPIWRLIDGYVQDAS